MPKNGQNPEDPWRWTINKAVVELKVTQNKVKGGLRRLGIEPGLDHKFSTRDIFAALNELQPLEVEAKKARLQSQIDEAAFNRDRRLEQLERLMPTD